MVSASLPPGFRFHPTDVELVLYYLKRKLLGKPLHFKAIVEVDLYKFAPWDLPEKSCLRSRDLEWFFFCPRDRKYNSGPRTNRTTEIGYWKTTGKDRAICNESQTVGIKKTLVFHLGRAPLGSRTNWVMHEYKLEDKNLSDAGISLDAYVLCKIFEKSGAGPKNGEQHGAPFDEKDWEDGLEVDNSLAPLLIAETGSEVDNSQVPLLATDTASLPSLSVDDNQDISMAKSMLDLSNKGGFSVESPCREASCDISTHNLPLSEDLDLDSLLACFGEVDDLCGNNNFTQKSGRLHYSWQTGLDQGSPLQELQLLTSQNNVHGSVQNDRIDIYSGLEDIYPGAELKAVDTSHLPDMGGNNGLDQTLLGNGNYLELKDLDSSIEYPMRGPGSVRTEFENFGTRSELETIDKLCFPNSLVTGNNSSLMELNDFENLLKYPIVANMNDKMISGSQYGQYLYPRVANMNDKITSGSHYDQYLSADAVLPAYVLGSCSKRPKVSGVLNDNLLMSSYDNIGSGSDAACICENASQSSLTAGRKGELGETHMGEALMRGEQHSEYSRLECLLGSIPARSASAAEYLSANGAKGYKGNSLVGYYSGSSTIVKAEVTDHCGCTNDALSGKLGEFPCLCCCGHRMCHEHKFLRMDAAAAACRSGFNLIFLISYMGSSHFVGVKLNWYTLKLIISS